MAKKINQPRSGDNSAGLVLKELSGLDLKQLQDKLLEIKNKKAKKEGEEKKRQETLKIIAEQIVAKIYQEIVETKELTTDFKSWLESQKTVLNDINYHLNKIDKVSKKNLEETINALNDLFLKIEEVIKTVDKENSAKSKIFNFINKTANKLIGLFIKGSDSTNEDTNQTPLNQVVEPTNNEVLGNEKTEDVVINTAETIAKPGNTDLKLDVADTESASNNSVVTSTAEEILTENHGAVTNDNESSYAEVKPEEIRIELGDDEQLPENLTINSAVLDEQLKNIVESAEQNSTTPESVIQENSDSKESVADTGTTLENNQEEEKDYEINEKGEVVISQKKLNQLKQDQFESIEFDELKKKKGAKNFKKDFDSGKIDMSHRYADLSDIYTGDKLSAYSEEDLDKIINEVEDFIKEQNELLIEMLSEDASDANTAFNIYNIYNSLPKIKDKLAKLHELKNSKKIIVDNQETSEETSGDSIPEDKPEATNVVEEINNQTGVNKAELNENNNQRKKEELNNKITKSLEFLTLIIPKITELNQQQNSSKKRSEATNLLTSFNKENILSGLNKKLADNDQELINNIEKIKAVVSVVKKSLESLTKRRDIAADELEKARLILNEFNKIKPSNEETANEATGVENVNNQDVPDQSIETGDENGVDQDAEIPTSDKKNEAEAKNKHVKKEKLSKIKTIENTITSVFNKINLAEIEEYNKLDDKQKEIVLDLIASNVQDQAKLEAHNQFKQKQKEATQELKTVKGFFKGFAKKVFYGFGEQKIKHDLQNEFINKTKENDQEEIINKIIGFSQLINGEKFNAYNETLGKLNGNGAVTKFISLYEKDVLDKKRKIAVDQLEKEKALFLQKTGNFDELNNFDFFLKLAIYQNHHQDAVSELENSSKNVAWYKKIMASGWSQAASERGILMGAGATIRGSIIAGFGVVAMPLAAATVGATTALYRTLKKQRAEKKMERFSDYTQAELKTKENVQSAEQLTQKLKLEIGSLQFIKTLKSGNDFSNYKNDPLLEPLKLFIEKQGRLLPEQKAFDVYKASNPLKDNKEFEQYKKVRIDTYTISQEELNKLINDMADEITKTTIKNESGADYKEIFAQVIGSIKNNSEQVRSIKNDYEQKMKNKLVDNYLKTEFLKQRKNKKESGNDQEIVLNQELIDYITNKLRKNEKEPYGQLDSLNETEERLSIRVNTRAKYTLNKINNNLVSTNAGNHLIEQYDLSQIIAQATYETNNSEINQKLHTRLNTFLDHIAITVNKNKRNEVIKAAVFGAAAGAIFFEAGKLFRDFIQIGSTSNNNQIIETKAVSTTELTPEQTAILNSAEQIKQYGGGKDFHFNYKNGHVSISRDGYDGTYELTDKGLLYADISGGKYLLEHGQDINASWKSLDEVVTTKKAPETIDNEDYTEKPVVPEVDKKPVVPEVDKKPVVPEVDNTYTKENIDGNTEVGNNSLDQETIDNSLSGNNKDSEILNHANNEDVNIHNQEITNDTEIDVHKEEVVVQPEIINSTPSIENIQQLVNKPDVKNPFEVVVNNDNTISVSRPNADGSYSLSDDNKNIIFESPNGQKQTYNLSSGKDIYNEDNWQLLENKNNPVIETGVETPITNETEALHSIFGENASIKITGTENNLNCEFKYSGIDYGNQSQDQLSKEILYFKKLQEIGLGDSNTAKAVKQSIENEVSIYNPLPNTNVEEMLKPEKDFTTVLSEISNSVGIKNHFDESFAKITSSEDLVKINNISRELFGEKYFFNTSEKDNFKVSFELNPSKITKIDHNLNIDRYLLKDIIKEDPFTNKIKEEIFIREIILYKSLFNKGLTNNNLYKLLENNIKNDFIMYKITIGDNTIEDNSLAGLKNSESPYWTAFKNAKLEDIIKPKQ